MKAYAVFQSLRYFFIAAAILVMGLLKVEGRFLTYAFTFAEALLLFIMLIYLNGIRMLGGKVKQEYLLAHIRFGTKILPANMVVELNTKVDIICLGFLVKNDSVIGIYSFAILFAEGFYQIYIVIRRSINPKLTEAYAGRRLEEEFTSLDKGLKKCFKWLSPFLMMAVTGFYCVVCLVLGREYFEGTKYLIVICAAMAANGRNIVYGNIFSQLGLPVIESGINVITVFSNFVMNLCFILLCGTMGALAATAVSHCIYGRLIKKVSTVNADYFIKMSEEEVISMVSVIIPAYNEAQAIGDTLRELSEKLSTCGFEYEVLVINDGSSDDTESIVRKMENEHIRCISHRVNRGYGSAIVTGVKTRGVGL